MNQKEILFIALTVFLTIVAWVVSDLYSIHKSTPTDEQIQSVKLEYSIDTAVIDSLETKTP